MMTVTLRRFSNVALVLLVALACPAAAQKTRPTTGGVKGRVRVEGGHTPSNVVVTVRQGEREVATTRTGKGGEFEVRGLAAGVYGLTFRKPGLSTGQMEGIEVRAGKTRSLPDRLYMPVDEGSLAFVRGAVFDQEGRSFRGAQVELWRLLPDGSAKRLDRRVASDIGSFSFRLPPEAARYRVTAKADGMREDAKEVEVDGAAIFRVALTLVPAAK